MREAKRYYNEKTYAHAVRVAQYVAENNLIPNDKMDDCIALAWMHDLKEDTEWRDEVLLSDYFNDCLDLITKPNDMDYIYYIKKIRKRAEIMPEVYWVKIAKGKIFDGFAIFIIRNI